MQMIYQEEIKMGRKDKNLKLQMNKGQNVML